MEGRLLFAPDPFVKQKWYGFKSGYCILKGSFLNFMEKGSFLSSRPEEYSIPLESCLVGPVPHPKKHLFEIVTSSGSKFNFLASSRVESEKWISKIKEKSLIPTQSDSSLTSTPTSQRLLSLSEDPCRRPTHSAVNHSCSSSLGVKDGQRTQKKGKVISEGLKKYGSMILGGAFISSGTFGLPLQYCKSSPRIKRVPLLVVICTDIIEERGLDHQGLYRVPGNTTQVNSLYHELTVSSEIVIDPDDERWKDINVVGSLLKLFFRKLPSPLITTELYRPAIQALRKASDEEKLSALRDVMKQLPKHHLETFRHLGRHLNKIATKEDTNKMSAHNLSIIFGPTLVYSKEENETAKLVMDMPDQCSIVELVIKNVEWLFGHDPGTNKEESDQKDPGDSGRQTTIATDPLHGNQELAASTAHKVEFEVIIESHFESDDAGIVMDGNSVYHVADHPSMNRTNFNELFAGCEVHSICNSCTSSTPASSRGHSPFTDSQTNPEPIQAKLLLTTDCQIQEMQDLDKISEGGGSNKNVPTNRNSGLLKNRTNENNLTEQALQHLKRLSFDLRTFKHRLEIEKLEHKQRTVSKERIEREYERTLNEFEMATAGSDSEIS